MMPDSPQSSAAGEPPLRGLSPRQIASLVRGIDSRLVSISLDDSAGERVLLYVFEVAGMRQPFRIAITAEPLASIADLYPEAAAREQELGRCCGLTFHPADSNEQ